MSTKEVKELKETVTQLRVRLNQIVDELSTFKGDVERFKSNVASDVKYLTERVDS